MLARRQQNARIEKFRGATTSNGNIPRNGKFHLAYNRMDFGASLLSRRTLILRIDKKRAKALPQFDLIIANRFEEKEGFEDKGEDFC